MQRLEVQVCKVSQDGWLFVRVPFRQGYEACGWDLQNEIGVLRPAGFWVYRGDLLHPELRSLGLLFRAGRLGNKRIPNLSPKLKKTQPPPLHPNLEKA